MNAIITGASSGIGLELARVCARNGHNLFLVARRLDELNQLKQELEAQHKVKVEVLRLDLSEHGAAQKAFEAAAAKFKTIDVLINNAGFGYFGKFIDCAPEKEAQMLALNIVALTELTKLALPGMIARKSGRIMNVASTAAFQPGPLMAVYFATKAYVLSFSEAIANELEGTGVTVTALCPGPTTSGFQSVAEQADSRLVKNRKLPSSLDVARYGYAAMMEGKVVAIHGTMNKLMANSVRFAPRSFVTNLARRAVEVK